MKINSKGKFEMKYLFLKPLSQNVEILVLIDDAINAKMGLKGLDWYFMYHC